MTTTGKALLGSAGVLLLITLGYAAGSAPGEATVEPTPSATLEPTPTPTPTPEPTAEPTPTPTVDYVQPILDAIAADDCDALYEASTAFTENVSVPMSAAEEAVLQPSIDAMRACVDHGTTTAPVTLEVGDPVAINTSTSEAKLTITKVEAWEDDFEWCDAKCLTVQVSLVGVNGSMDWSPFEFTLVTDDGEVYEVAPMFREPSLPYDITLEQGDKVKGWLTFDVPKSLKHGTIKVADVDIAF